MRELFKINLIVSFLFVFTGFGQENNVVIGIPEANTLYRGYTNIIQIGFTNKSRDFILKCKECDTIYSFNDKINEYVVKPGSSRALTIEIYDKKQENKLLGKKEYRVSRLPDPTLFIDGSKQGEELGYLPRAIFTKYLSENYQKASFTVLKWEIFLGEKSYVGTGNRVSEDVIEALKQNPSKAEIIYVYVIYIGPDEIRRSLKGEFFINRMKFEFDGVIEIKD